MKKFFKVIGYIFLILIALVLSALVIARFLAPVIMEKALIKDFSNKGIEAEVNIEIDRLGLFGIDIPEVLIDLGSEEVHVSNVSIDLSDAIRGNNEVRVRLGDINLYLSDMLISYLGTLGLQKESLDPLKNTYLKLESPYMVADRNEVYLEVGRVELGLPGEGNLINEIETDGFKGTATWEGKELIVTPLSIYGNGEEIITLDEGIYSSDLEHFRFGQVRTHKFLNLPEIKISNLNATVGNKDMIITSDGVEASGIEKTEKLFEKVVTEEVRAEVKDAGIVLLDTTLWFAGEKKPLDKLGVEMGLMLQENSLSIEDGLIRHRKFKKTIPFNLASEGNILSLDIAGSKTWTIDTEKPDENTISEIMSFILMKLASSLFGL